MKVDQFLGMWKLDPDQSRYELGEPPERASYLLQGDDEKLVFQVNYDLGGLQMTLTYLAQPDGLLHDYDDVNGIVDRLMTSVVDAKTLVTTSWSHGTEIAHASRVLSDDGLAMTISQSGFGADGESFCNLSVYRKVQ